ncbi:MAG TPA: hypothetical protein VE732_05565 [Nitrososphaera sp.]|nr:hypothetical protein [Nitrososphaera sp.]
MTNTSTPLRERALHAYRQVLAEKLREDRLYRQLALREALQLKVWELFGGEYLIDVEENVDEHVLGAVVEGLNFFCIRAGDADVQLILIESCNRCGYKMTSQPITSIVALGRELLQLEVSGKLSNHKC